MPENFSLELPLQFGGILHTISFIDIIDVFIVAAIIYAVYEMLENTRAMTLVKGLIFLLLVTMLANWLKLHTIYWLLQKIVTWLFVALPIVFQPELRRALERIGQGNLFRASTLPEDEAQNVVRNLTKAVKTLSAKKIGALLVIERDTGLDDIASTGIKIDAFITAEFLMNIFIPNTPLHDGAAIIRGNRLTAAACLLPLTDNRSLSTELGTRHRAAIGLSEQCDALVIIVSEETGIVSIAENGHIMRHLNTEMLTSALQPIFFSQRENLKDMLNKWRKKL